MCQIDTVLEQRLLHGDLGVPETDDSERVRVQDEATNALLDEALAELRVQAAKREALVGAFQASGRPISEFAEMYGMRADDVADAVARVRTDSERQAAA